MTGRSDFPEAISRLLGELEEESFSVAFGEVERLDTPGFIAERGDTIVQVADHEQAWFVTLRSSDRPRVDEMWDRPSCVRREVSNWLDEAGGCDA